ncbi:MAG: DNA polymerase III subunit beta [Patescibacteria group bacterium]
MKISVLQENLKQSLAHVQKAIPSRPSLPILTSVLLTAGENKTTIAATDLYFGIRTTFPTTTEEKGVIVLPGKQLRDIIFSLPVGSMKIEHSESTARIQSSAGKASLQSQNSEEYPPFPEVEGNEITLLTKDLSKIVTNIVPSASTDQTRPVLTSVLMEFSDKQLKAVATDGFRLAIETLEIKNSPKSGEGEGFSLLVPAKVLVEVKNIAEQLEVEEISCSVSTELKQLFFSIGAVEVFARLIEGEFPPYSQILPTEFVAEVAVESDVLADQVKRAMIFARDSSSIIQIAYASEQLVISASSPAIGSFEGEIGDHSFSGEKGVIAFNAKYVLDFLQLYKSQTVRLKISGELKPALLVTEKSPGYQYVIMPFRLNQ